LLQPGTVLIGGYWDSALTLPAAILGGPARSMAVLGNAAGTIDRADAHIFPSTTIDAVEIDSALTQIGSASSTCSDGRSYTFSPPTLDRSCAQPVTVMT
jgi:hypothetical protein